MAKMLLLQVIFKGRIAPPTTCWIPRRLCALASSDEFGAVPKEHDEIFLHLSKIDEESLPQTEQWVRPVKALAPYADDASGEPVGIVTKRRLQGGSRPNIICIGTGPNTLFYLKAHDPVWLEYEDPILLKKRYRERLR